MLKFFPSGAPDTQSEALWADLLDASPAEMAEVERVFGVHVPSRARLSEIESSSRLGAHDGVLSMSMPMIDHADDGDPRLSPLGFVLSRDRLVTIRFTPLRAFDAVAASFDGSSAQPNTSLETFVDLCDEIIDRLADNLEQAADELRALSTTIFDTPDDEGRHAIRSNRLIRAELGQVGRLANRLSDARSILLGAGRAMDFACELTTDWPAAQQAPRMRSLRQDVASLDDYQVHLSDKVQFLLDAMVGLIGIAQNDVFKILTIVSIVGIPPTLVASIYGMNFKLMPELNWSLGYPYGLTVIVLSGLIPLIWFKWRGWF
jgi:magnesium transporter